MGLNIFSFLEFISSDRPLGLTQVLIALTAVFVGSRILKYRRDLQAVSHAPGLRVPFTPLGLPGALLPTTSWNAGLMFPWTWRKTLYARYGTDTISIVPYISGTAGFYTSNIDVARQVASPHKDRSYEKPLSASGSITLYGMNLVAADGDIWRRHRRIMGPAFNNELYKLVWSETLKIYSEMVDVEGFATRPESNVSAVQSLTFKLALVIIGRCGFGFPFTWTTDQESTTDASGEMSVQEALRIVADSNMVALLVPRWIRELIPTKFMREGLKAQDRLQAFMRAQVIQRKQDLASGASNSPASAAGKDAFTMLVEASENEGNAKLRLEDDELIGNVFIMLFAGHETTAHSIAATLGFLSLDPALQQEVYDQLVEVVGLEGDPQFGDYNKLDKVLAAFFEALRMFPSGHILIREAFEDTVLQIPNPNPVSGSEDEKITLPILKGTQVIVDMIGVQYNPRNFEDPYEYKPSRWRGVAVESEAFSAFSIGPRTCIGRKFATTEVVCFLTMLLRDFTIEPILQARETKEEWRARVLDATMVLTLGVKDVPLKFVRRQKA
ncbi:hypothetical protein D9619_010824 [Psilocybe cf. subviscida]|uniref:Cytochrome P450 n=1 Tax=Psilocybe cf. subviscida TaxID=2480587 RepID=A0A8H5EZY3_9AGAR|nr:hypothetical protein D9619_010824 [Psilocybe cf. subviscida]